MQMNTAEVFQKKYCTLLIAHIPVPAEGQKIVGGGDKTQQASRQGTTQKHAT